MRFSLTKSFTRLAFLTLVSVFILSLGGWLVAATTEGSSCFTWPLCVPVGLAGWAQLLHRFSAGTSTILIVALLVQAWRTQRDHRLLLPLTTVSTVLYFAQIFVGAVQVERGFPVEMVVMHSFVACSLWFFLIWLFIASGLYAGETVTFPPVSFFQRLKDYLVLTKPIIVLLLLVTTFAGMVAGAKALPSLPLILWTLLGGALAAGGSGAINQYIDRDLDKNMQRTARRPMAIGRMTPAEGLAFGLALCISSFFIMAVFVNLLAAFLSLAGIFYYVFLYSVWLKKATVQNIVIGGGAGAIPPLVGWASATGRLDINALVLFLIVFMWTPPHFWALAIVRRKDYERAGVPMMPVIKGEQETRKQVFVYTLELVAVTFLLPILKYTGVIYFISALVLGGIFVFYAWKVYKVEGNKVAWTLYRYSSMYLMFIFLALVIDVLVRSV